MKLRAGPLAPAFALCVFRRGSTNQAPVEVASVDKLFNAERVAIGKVISLTRKQRGQALRGERIERREPSDSWFRPVRASKRPPSLPPIRSV